MAALYDDAKSPSDTDDASAATEFLRSVVDDEGQDVAERIKAAGQLLRSNSGDEADRYLIQMQVTLCAPRPYVAAPSGSPQAKVSPSDERMGEVAPLGDIPSAPPAPEPLSDGQEAWVSGTAE